MKIHFNIHYTTKPGQNICISGSSKALGNWNPENSFSLNYIKSGNWVGAINLPKTTKQIEYKYLLKNEDGSIVYEWGKTRVIQFSDFHTPLIFALDNWRDPSNAEKVMYSSAFHNAIMPPNPKLKGKFSKASQILKFRLQVPRSGKGYQVCISGNQPALGNWDKKKPLLLGAGNDFPEWTASINITELNFPLEYKFGLFDPKKKEMITFESGENRIINLEPHTEKEYTILKTDESFRYPNGNWKGSGVAVPVFSLRSNNSFGVGDFDDLKSFIDWAKLVGMNMVQILPINETIASHNWLDSYPYKSISVMALHPIYLNLEKMGALKNKKNMAEFARKGKKLNCDIFVNYPEVLNLKSKYYKLLFDQVKAQFFKSADYKSFFENNKEWLVPYAAFAYLRDKMKSPDFRTWGTYSKYDKKKINKIANPKSKEWDDISIHYFIQYHLDKQLHEVTDHARKNGIVLKGDIPIGISPNSVEAWTEPHLFHLAAQAGAPPDDFSDKGQNWGFPTYNWEAMAKENYSWWKKRLQKMGDFFDAYRIDHILGFFRIWEIPIHAVEGVLGYFNKAIPLKAEEIRSFGIHFEPVRMAKPYVRLHLLKQLFGKDTDEIKTKFFEKPQKDIFKFKKAYDSQRKINQYFLKGIEEEDLTEKNKKFRDNLFDLLANVLFIQTGKDKWHPRILLAKTSSYSELDEQTKKQLIELYNYFFFKRHEAFWREEGLNKLPPIMTASEMLVCGEDLGMVPDCVPPVMDQLNILSLEIQRMSKKPEYQFAKPEMAPYLSICTTSTHDMATIRGWWEEDRDLIQRFFNEDLGQKGLAPFFAEPWVCQQIVAQHFYSPAMWVTLPIQDLIALDGDFRWDETHMEKINDPSNVRHKWRFRMHQSIEELKKAKKLNQALKQLVEDSGRDSEY